MTTDRKPEPEILNPRYAGGTAEMVARALLRRDDDRESRDSETEPCAATGGKNEFQSSI